METTAYEPALTPEEIVREAEKTEKKYLGRGCNPADCEEVKGVVILAMTEALARAKPGEAVRAFQWAYAFGQVKRFWKTRIRHAKGSKEANREKRQKDFDYAQAVQIGQQKEAKPGDDMDAAIVGSIEPGAFCGGDRMDTLASDNPGPVDALEPESVEVQKMRVCLSRLPEYMANILRRHYLEGATLDEIGTSMKLTRERVRQLEVEGLEKMKRMILAA